MDIVLRSEYRKEHRTVITPSNAHKLIMNGCRVFVEKSADRIYQDQDYKDVGCDIVDQEYWRSTNPSTTLVIGLKELPSTITDITHTMTHFQHCLKGQDGSQEILNNFKKGLLYDIEYFTDISGRRLLSFSKNAGFVGAALSLLKWISITQNTRFYENYKQTYTEQELIDIISKQLINVKPSIIIIGALGKCGEGALKLFNSVGIECITKWDVNETKTPGPYKEILQHDILINTIMLSKDALPNPFVTTELLEHNTNLKVIVDVSCDVYSKNNVLPINKQVTTLDTPFYEVFHDIHFCAVDNLPSLIPKDASDQFSDVFTELVLKYGNDEWIRCGKVFLNAIRDI